MQYCHLGVPNVESVNQCAYCLGGIQPECLIRNQRIVGMVHKILSNVLYVTVASYQDCYFVARNTSFNQLVYSVQCCLHHSVFNIFTAQELNTDRTIRNRMVVRYLLADIAICAFQLFTFFRTFICQVFNLQFYCFCEKSIVKLNDVSIRAVVDSKVSMLTSFALLLNSLSILLSSLQSPDRHL